MVIDTTALAAILFDEPYMPSPWHAASNCCSKALTSH